MPEIVGVSFPAGGSEPLEVEVQFHKTGNARWRWLALATEDNDEVAEARSGSGFSTLDEAKASFARAVRPWVVVE